MGCGCNSMQGFGAFGSDGVDLAGAGDAVGLCLAANATPIMSANTKMFYGCAPQPKPAGLPSSEKWFEPGCACPPLFGYDTSSGMCMGGDSTTPVAPTGCPVSKTTTYVLYGVGALAVGLIAWQMMKK